MVTVPVVILLVYSDIIYSTPFPYRPLHSHPVSSRLLQPRSEPFSSFQREPVHRVIYFVFPSSLRRKGFRDLFSVYCLGLVQGWWFICVIVYLKTSVTSL